MIYDIRHITRFDYGNQVKFARCNLRLKPIDWPGQTLDDYRLTVEPVGRLGAARAEAGLANVTRLVVDTPVRTLSIESAARVTVDRLVPVPDAAGISSAMRERGVAVRPFPALPYVGDALRISVGPWEMLEACLGALREVL